MAEPGVGRSPSLSALRVEGFKANSALVRVENRLILAIVEAYLAG